MLSRRQWQRALLGGALTAAALVGVWAVRPSGAPRAPRPASLGQAPVRASLAGRVVDRAGRPIVGAQLVVTPEAGGAVARAVSEVDGRFSLEAAAAEVRVQAEAGGFLAQEIRHLALPEEGLELSLARRLGLDGVVRSGGRPAAGAELELAGATGRRTGVAGPDGAFAFAELPEGRYAVRAVRGDEQAYLDPVIVGAADAGVGLLAIELERGRPLDGQLLDRAGKPILGGEVTLVEAPNGPLPRTTRTAPDGSFRFAPLGPGSYLVSARAEGYYGGEPRRVEIASGKPARASLALERGAVIEGSVVDERDRPIAGVRLEVSGEGLDGAPVALTGARAGGAGWARLEPAGELGILRGPIPFPPLLPSAPGVAIGSAPSATIGPAPSATIGPAPGAAGSPVALDGFASDAHGAFKLTGLPPGKLVVAASHPDFGRVASAPIEARAGGSYPVKLRLTRGETVRGRVTDERGQPLAGVELLADGRLVGLSDARGGFELPHVRGALQLTARLSGYLPATAEVRPGAAPPELELRRAEGRLGGLVVDERGSPLAGARVEVQAAVVPPRTLTTGRDGRFGAEGLGPGPYRVLVSHAEYAPRGFEGVPPGDEARFALEPGAGLAGEVRDARSGELLPKAQLRLTASEGTARALPLSRGRFSVTALPSGHAVLEASAAGFVRYRRELELPPGERPRELTLRDFVVELERAGVVLGQVRDDRGDPVPGAPVQAGGVSGRTDARGELRLEGVPPGRIEVRAELPGRTLSEAVEVRAGEDSRVDLRP